MFRTLQISAILCALVLCSNTRLYSQTAPPAPGSCAFSNSYTPNLITNLINGQEHSISAGHGVLGYQAFTCTYTGPTPTPACAVTCQASLPNTGTFEDKDSLTTLISKHAVNMAVTVGGASALSGEVTCGSAVGVIVNTCLIGNPSCSATISVSASPSGLGVTFTFGPITLWNATSPLAQTCQAEKAICIPGKPPSGSGADGAWVWNAPTCTWVWQKLGNTPIIIDTDDSGFHLTSATNGVLFDFSGTGKIPIAWTAAGSTNGWLALDRNGNGIIDSGQELFGNVTSQPTSPNPNGFLALAVFDTPAQGGNGDGIIDSHDTIWPKLLVWIDSNHDGISQPGELHTLDAIGIHSISLAYISSPYTDAYGNQFRYKGSLIPDNGYKVDRLIYDVILGTVQ